MASLRRVGVGLRLASPGLAALPPLGGAEGSTIVNDLMSEHATLVSAVLGLGLGLGFGLGLGLGFGAKALDLGLKGEGFRVSVRS